MSTDYNYDNEAQFFPFFIATMSGIVASIATYDVLKPSKELENTAPRIHSTFWPEENDLIEKQRRKQKRRELKSKRIILAIIGWLMVAWMSYLIIVTERTATKLWDPYKILSIPMSADAKTIKARYKKLSLTMHPDKARLDPEKNITAESVNDLWVEMTDAYKSLTDEETRKKWELYGHPDGKQSFSIGIALPQFIVNEGNGKYVLLIYGALLGIVLPLIVGKWWYGTQRMTRDKVLVTSAGTMFTEYHEEMSTGDIVSALSSGEEYREVGNSETAEKGCSKIEMRIAEEADGIYKEGMAESDRLKLRNMDDSQRRKALALLWAYMGRLDLGDPTLDEEKFEVAPIASVLNESFIQIALAYGNTAPLLRAYHVGQCLVQAMPPFSSPLLQIPFFTSSIIKSVETALSSPGISVQQFMDKPEHVRKKLLVESKLLTAEQYAVAKSIAVQIPAMVLEKAWFKVVGEKVITPSSFVQFVVKTRIIPPGMVNVPNVYAPDLEDVDPKEDDLEAINGKKKKKVMTKEGKLVEVAADVSVQPPLAHAPYFARDRPPRWRLFLSENKSGKIAVPPFTFDTFERALYDDEGKPTCAIQTLKMQFQAPPGPGEYCFTMNLVCDSYVGLDIRKDVVMVVAEASQADQIEEEEEISEPEEDSIAGQMSALKGGSVSKKRVKKVVEENEDDSDGSNTDGESGEDSDDTDTDTDTSDEE